jgi:hypothetical protein
MLKLGLNHYPFFSKRVANFKMQHRWCRIERANSVFFEMLAVVICGLLLAHGVAVAQSMDNHSNSPKSLTECAGQ